MNAQAYKGIRPFQTAAQRADRVLRATLGPTAYAAMRQERETYYRDLIRQVSARRAKV